MLRTPTQRTYTWRCGLRRSCRSARVVTLLLVALLVVGSGGIAPGTASAVAPGNPHFLRVWERYDKPVRDEYRVRTWTWGPEANTNVLTEPYVEGVDGRRDVQYFDKSRMEITRPDADPSSLWYVTNGLLVVELLTGHVQLGHSLFEQRAPAEVNVAGDPDDASGPTYATLARLRDLPPLPDGAVVTQRIDRAGNVSPDEALTGYGVTVAQRVQAPGIDHQVAAPFWTFMQEERTVWEDGQYVYEPFFPDPFYATGLPVTEPYWTTVNVAGTPHDVLLQCFERRCLTYTPSNAPDWQVEMGNVGQHYYRWRYLEPDRVSQPITAASGGVVSLGTLARLTLPAGALAADTTVTLQRLPATSDHVDGHLPVGPVLDVSTAGVALLAPVTLEIGYAPAQLPPRADETRLAAARRDDGGTWQLQPSTVDPAGDRVTIATQQLSQWSLFVPEPPPVCAPAGTTTLASRPGYVYLDQPFSYVTAVSAAGCAPGASAALTVELPLPASAELLGAPTCVSRQNLSHLTCSYRENDRTVVLAGAVVAGDEVELQVTVRVPASTSSPPGSLATCATTSDGVGSHQSCVTTTVDSTLDPPAKVSDPATVAPGGQLSYVITFVTDPDAVGSGGIRDPLPAEVELLDVQCFTLTGQTSGICRYDATTHTAELVIPALVPYDTLRMVVTARLLPRDDGVYPPALTNCAQVEDGARATTTCATTTIVVP